MNRSLLTPRWLLLHLLFAAAVVTTGLLAWWQWERAYDAGGSFQNLGYALQWPLFGAFTVFLWYRVARMHVYADEADNAEEIADSAASPEMSSPSRDGEDAEPTRKRPLVPPPAPPVDPDEDPELAAYNQYLAELNESESRR